MLTMEFLSMRYFKLYITLLFILIRFISFSQNQTNIWYFGDKAGLNFNTNPISALNDGVFSHAEGISSICDINGDLLFFTNGINVWNANNQVMPNGSGLFGNNSSSQILIVPKPGNCNIYYIFTTPAQNFAGISSYSTIDMRLDNGNGDLSEKNNILTETITERLSGTLHTNGVDYWVVYQELGSNNFISYKITSAGVNPTPIISSTGIINAIVDDAVGSMKFSGDGKKLCTANELGFKKCQLFDFDNQTGIVSNGFVISDTEGYGVEFSNDNKKLYISSYQKFRLMQFDLSSNNPVTIINSQILLADFSSITNENGGSLQIASNNKIYVARNNKTFVGVIDNPNVSGAGCNFINNAISLNGKKCYAGLPNFIKNYTGSFCGNLKANYLRATSCGGNDITINVIATYGTPPYLYSLDALQFQNSNIFTNLPASDYDITVKDAMSEIRKVTLKIPVILKVELIYSNVINSDCGFANGSVALSNLNGNPPFQYSKNGLNFQNNNTFDNLPTSTIIFFIKDSLGCIDTTAVKIGTKTNLKVFAGRDTGIFINYTLALFAKDLTNSNFIKYKWFPSNGLDNDAIQNPTATITKNIDYVVEATTTMGCVVRDTIKIEVYKDVEIFVASAFTPNNDNLNDVIRARPRGITTEIYFSIYNRYGKLVFATKNFSIGWDGKINTATQNTGSFIWIAEGIDIRGNKVIRKGSFTLLK